MAGGRRVREPYAALIGFYPAEREALVKAIEDSFLDRRFGPGRLPGGGGGGEAGGSEEPLGGVAPHAGYSYSGPAAAHFYLWLAETGVKPDTVVIVGTNHTGYGGYYTTSSSWEEWATPLGGVPVDLEFIDVLSRLYPGLDDNYLAHLEEHSVEVQLPFLQYIYDDKFSLVPIVAKEVTPRMAGELAAAVKAAAEKLDRRVVFIASSDFTHHGPMYGYVVFTENVAENVARLDMTVIEQVLKLDSRGFLRVIMETGATVCGVGAIPALIEYARLHERPRARLLKYYNSAQLTGDESIAVGYAAIAVYNEAG